MPGPRYAPGTELPRVHPRCDDHDPSVEDADVRTSLEQRLKDLTLDCREQALSIPPESHYRGAENQLHRIEAHRDGMADEATFKWSRDNGSVVFPIVKQNGQVVTLPSLGRDQRTGLMVNDWVEIVDDGIELRGEPGIASHHHRAGAPAAHDVEGADPPYDGLFIRI